MTQVHSQIFHFLTFIPHSMFKLDIHALLPLIELQLFQEWKLVLPINSSQQTDTLHVTNTTKRLPQTWLLNMPPSMHSTYTNHNFPISPYHNSNILFITPHHTLNHKHPPKNIDPKDANEC